MSGSFNKAQQKSRNGGRKKQLFPSTDIYTDTESRLCGLWYKNTKNSVSSESCTKRYVNLGKLSAPHAFTSAACLTKDSCENETTYNI